MRITYFQFAVLEDGSSRALINIISRMIKSGHKIQVVLAKKTDLSIYLEQHGVKCDYVNYRLSSCSVRGNNKFSRLFFEVSSYLYSLIINFLTFLIILRKVYVFSPDIIHTNIGSIHQGYYLSKLLNIPHVWHIREFQGTKYTASPIFCKKYLRTLFSNSNLIYVSNSLKEYFSINNNSIVIYDGVLSEKFEPSEISGKENEFLFIGRIEESKGVTELFLAFAEFLKIRRDYKLVLVGRCDEASYMKFLDNMITKYRMESNICFRGVSNNIYPLIRKAKFVVVSSFIEGFGYVTAEAMFNKTLVIGYNSSGTKEQFDNILDIYGNDQFLRYTNRQELIDALLMAAKLDTRLYNQMTDNAFKVAKKKYSTELNVQQIENYYKTIML